MPEHMVMIAVERQPGAERVDFRWLAQASIERERGERVGASLKSPLGRLLQAGMFGHGETLRGLRTLSLERYAVRRLTWHVIDRDE
jgi:hypothetical protein